MEPTGKTASEETDNTDVKDDLISESATRTETDVLFSDSESSDFDREYSCDICEKEFSGLKPLKQHQKSAKHLKALRKSKLKKDIEDELNDSISDEDFSLDKNKIYAECEICDKEFNGPESYNLHLRSKIHKRKVKNCKILEKSKENGKINKDKLKQIIKRDTSPLEASVQPRSSESNSDVFECEDCDKVFSGLEPFRDHMSSKAHRKKLKQKKLTFDLGSDIEDDEGDLVCRLCRKSFSGPENALDHLKSKGHLEWLEFKKWKREKKELEKKETESKQVNQENNSKESAESLKITENTTEDDGNCDSESQSTQARIYYKEYKEIMNKSEPVE